MDFLFNADTQEKIALLIVGSVALCAGMGVFRAVFARGLAVALLKRGWVSLAMKLRGMEKSFGCGSCGPKAGEGCGTKTLPRTR
jgi:predicted alpha/beta hydrolase